MLRVLVTFCTLYCVVGVPVIPQKKIAEDILRNQLGEDEYLEFRRELAKEKVEQMKQYVHLKPDERDQYVKNLKDEHEKRLHHETVYEPGSKPQLQEVWKDEDHMDPDTFSPTALFMTHDLNGDKVLDEHEINALIEHELEKVYSINSTVDEPLRAFESKRMRRAFLKAMDHNKDGKVTIDEFLSYEQDEDPDDEWTPLEDLQEVPDFEHKTEDKEVLDYAEQALKQHPDDEEMEEVMHMLHGSKGIPNPTGVPVASYADVKAAGGGFNVHPPAAAAQHPSKNEPQNHS